MGAIKGRAAEERAMVGWAQQMLVEAGAIEVCKIHQGLADRLDPSAVERAVKLAATEAREIALPEIRRLVELALMETGLECFDCVNERS